MLSHTQHALRRSPVFWWSPALWRSPALIMLGGHPFSGGHSLSGGHPLWSWWAVIRFDYVGNAECRRRSPAFWQKRALWRSPAFWRSLALYIAVTRFVGGFPPLHWSSALCVCCAHVCCAPACCVRTYVVELLCWILIFLATDTIRVIRTWFCKNYCAGSPLFLQTP